ncbi:flavin-containing monooxygenase 5-like [Diadema antillarum]|uniref:flavin-containing monooxygenase 5-like n=1 Tax=Diadema antillarum TaxID=105358 RepID=UPI003A88D551
MNARPPARRVAVIGGGPSGLVATKTCLEEGLDVVCFEKSNVIGGLWYYREDRTEQSCVFRSTVINTSKETMCFSDFPIPEDWPNFLHNKKVLQYFEMYADHFGLRKHIKLQTKVNSVKPAPDFDTTGRWTVSLTSMGSNKTWEETFDAVFVCSGHHCQPNIPHFEGLKNFKGTVMHTHDYLTPEKYRDKRVVIVGIGNSGGDAAVELGRMASSLFLSTRSGAWIRYRISDKSVPFDLGNRIERLMPMSLQESILLNENKKRVDHDLIGLKPDFGILAAHPTVNDDLPGCIMNGLVTVKPNIRRFTTTGVVFEDGTAEDNIDLVVLATGYKISFPFLSSSVLPINDNRVEMYRYVFSPHHKHPTLAVLGMVQPLGPIFPSSELQARWATRVFKGEKQLPTKAQMMEHIRRTQEAMDRRYKKSPRHTIQIDVMPYLDEIASEIGVKPNLLVLLLTDPALAYHYIFGPYVPAQYRLYGRHRWAGAREHMMTVWQRVHKPYKARQGGASMKELEVASGPKFGLLQLFIILGILAVIYFRFFQK